MAENPVLLTVDTATRFAGLALYDGEHYSEALEAFSRATEAAAEGSLWRFTSLVWQGHLLDLLDRRDEALERYREALAAAGGHSMQHSQYGLEISRAWVEERLREPFVRE